MRRVLLAATLGSLAAAQAAPTLSDLRPFERCFTDLALAGPALAIVCVPGRDPLVCRAGTIGGRPIDGRTLMPVGALALFLLADALALSQQLDAKVGELGGQPVTVGELLAGVAALPGYVDWLGGSRRIESAELLRCAAVADRLGHAPIRDSASLAATVLCEPLLTRARAPDLATALRVRLAPLIGLDPRDAATLTEAQQQSVFCGADAELRRAQPNAARLLLTVDQLARWWHWRLTQPMATLSTPVSSTREVAGQDGVERWSTSVGGPGTPQGYVWADRRAALLLWTGAEHRDALLAQCEACLFGSPAKAEGDQYLGGYIPVRPVVRMPAALAGSRWIAVDDAGQLQLRVSITGAGRFEVQRGGVVFAPRSSRRVQGGWIIQLQPAAGDAEAELLLATIPGDPDRMEAVLIQRLAWLRVLPEHFVVVRQPQDGK